MSLFNGRDLTGWKTDPSFPGNWRVENGVIVGTGGNTYLVSERSDYGDFHLHVQTRVGPGTTPAYTSGCPSNAIKRANPKDRPPRVTSQNQRQQPNRFAQDRQHIYLAANERTPTGNKLAQSPVPPDEWFTLDVIAEGNHLVVQVNGTTTTDIRDPSDFYPRGSIALFVFQGAAPVEFRKIEIRELPAGHAGSGLAGQPNQKWNTPAFQQWIKATQALPAEQQVEAVSKKLMELNPGFDGKLTGYDGRPRRKIENGVVTELALSRTT